MQEYSEPGYLHGINGETAARPVERITALWALSEAAMGGLLHALHIPLTGLFIGGNAVLFITLISFFTPKPGAILKATVMVMAIKLMVSPHSPINAYFAVAFQGISGELIFRLIKNKRLAPLLLGVISLLQSAFQKILVVTLVFGQSIWEAIDLFSNYVLNQFFVNAQISEEFSLSFVLIILYVSIHLAGGLFFGWWAPVLAKNVMQGMASSIGQITIRKPSEANPKNYKKSRSRKLWKRFSYLLIIFIALSIFILSYMIPVFERSDGMAALIMIVRSFIIIAIWFFAAGPFLMKKLRRFLARKESDNRHEISHILNLLPSLKTIISQSWKNLPDKKRMRWIGTFTENLLIYVLSVDLQEVE